MGADVAKQRSTFGKLERQRAQQAVAKAKHERRTARTPEGSEERPATTTDPAVEAEVLDKFARLQAAFDDGQMTLDDFELRRNELRTASRPERSVLSDMTASFRRPPLSVLDLAIVNAGGSSAQALKGTTELAQQAERLGYQRFWVAEHHNMASVASTTPPVLMAHLAARTDHIRVGSGGIMLPNHTPLIVAEHIAALEALHPGRIDLGLGRAPADPATTVPPALERRLRGRGLSPRSTRPHGPAGRRPGRRRPVGALRATPAATSSPQILLLGSSGYSAQLAGILGLPFAFAHHFDTGGTLEALELYREAFRPSPVLDEPYVIVTANVWSPPTDDEADWEVWPGPPDDLRDPPGPASRRCVTGGGGRPPRHGGGSGHAVATDRGRAGNVVAQLDDLVAASGADEIMVSTVAHASRLGCAAWSCWLGPGPNRALEPTAATGGPALGSRPLVTYRLVPTFISTRSG